MVELRVIGELAVVRDGAVLPLPASKKTRALLGYLAVTARPQLREKLCTLLWDGPDDPRAALRWSLTKLRPLVELATDRERVELIGARVDLAALRAAVPGAVAKASTEALRSAAAFAHGELLEGLELPDCFRYDEWLRAEREAVRRIQVSVASALVGRLPAAEALDHARAWVALEPLDEAAHTAVIRALVELDRRVDALGQYERCERLLERELGRAPSRELARLRIAIGTVAAPVVEVLVRAVAPVLPLIGRTGERAALIASLDAPRARVTLLLGDPGIGKSRLLDELSALATERGYVVMRGRGVEAEQVRPFGAWLDAVASDEPFHQEADRARLFEAVTAWLLARGAPVLVILDDLQWLDEASAALLHYLARTPAAAAIRLACAARPGELADNAQALRLVRSLTREGAVHQIGVSALDPDDTAALAALHAPGVDVARVVAESGGHPLFAVEIARALARGESTFESLDALLAERLALVDGTAREIVPWAAALGGAFEPDVLCAVSGVPLVELARAITELERRALVRPAGEDWDFAHDLIRTAAYHSVSAPRRRLLHLQIARTFATLPDPDGARAVAIAHHAGLGGDARLCARACLAACQRCLRLCAPEEAMIYVDRGLAHAAQLVGPERAELRIDLLNHALDADIRRARRETVATEMRRAVLDGQATGASSAVARGWGALSRIAYDRGDYAGAAQASRDAAERARASDAEAQGQALAFSAQCLAVIGRDLDRAEEMLAEAAQLLAQTTIELPELPFALALIRHHQGDVPGSIMLLERTTELALRKGQHWFAGYSWSRGALWELGRGRHEQALALCQDLRANAHLIGDGAELPCGRVVEAAAHLALGNGDASMIEAALNELRAADAPAVLAPTLVCLAEVELALGLIDEAMQHAAEAVTAATRVERASDIVLARALLLRIAEHDGRTDTAAAQRAALRDVPVDALGSRARAVLADL